MQALIGTGRHVTHLNGTGDENNPFQVVAKASDLKHDSSSSYTYKTTQIVLNRSI